jgi:hypothetical protein
MDVKPDNRGGRAPGTRNRRTVELMALAEVGETPCAFALRVMRDDSQPQDIRLHAAKLAAPYVHPKPQPEPRMVSFHLPARIDTADSLLQVHATLLKATADGDLALDEAREVSAILETHRRLVETVDLEARITRLEGTVGK